jgi:hypothetical protein
MPINHDARLVFIHIPKTGGTSIEAALGMFHRWQDENTDAAFGLIQSPQWMSRGWVSSFLQHLSYSELAELAPAEVMTGYFSFAWIRNPWDRMVSVYSNTDPHLLGEADQSGLQLRGLRFPDFVAALEGFEHVHLRPQHEFILTADGQTLVDFVGRFEHFARDFTQLVQSARLRPGLVLPHKNASGHAGYRSLYDEASRRAVEHRYAADIERFGYRF